MSREAFGSDKGIEVRADAFKCAVDLAHSINTYNSFGRDNPAIARPPVLTLTNVLDFAERIEKWIATGERPNE